MSTYVIGDTHGYRRTLEHLLKQIGVVPGDELIFLGDFFDRGPDSKALIDDLLELKARGIRIVGTWGNHELIVLGAIGYGRLLPDGTNDAGDCVYVERNGFGDTAKSYGWHWSGLQCDLDSMKLPESHLEFLLGLEQYILLPGFLIVHAHLSAQALAKPTAAEAIEHQLDTDPRGLQWERDTMRAPKAFPELIIHGHTPVYGMIGEPGFEYTSPTDVRVLHGRLNIDTGIIKRHALTAVELPSLRVIQQKCMD